MKRESKITLRLFFLLAVLFCSGLDVYSNHNIRTTIIEQSALNSCGEINSFSDADFFDDEQSNQISDLLPGIDYTYQIPFPQNCLLIPCYPSPIWQPPKIRI